MHGTKARDCIGWLACAAEGEACPKFNVTQSHHFPAAPAILCLSHAAHNVCHRTEDIPFLLQSNNHHLAGHDHNEPPKPPMESVGSNSPRSSTSATTVDFRYNPAQHVADRIIRALHHRLRLLHRYDTNFFILGATGNVYTVTLATTSSCTCPDRAVPCKHILFVLIRVLRLSFDDACIWRRTLRPWQLARLLGTPTSPDVLAGSRARERFYQLFSGNGDIGRTWAREDDGAACPICLEEMGGGARLVTCSTCGNSLHGECLLGWRRSRGRSWTRCVVCRARWRERREQERYVSLAEYVSDEDEGGDGGLYAG